MSDFHRNRRFLEANKTVIESYHGAVITACETVTASNNTEQILEKYAKPVLHWDKSESITKNKMVNFYQHKAPAPAMAQKLCKENLLTLLGKMNGLETVQTSTL